MEDFKVPILPLTSVKVETATDGANESESKSAAASIPAPQNPAAPAQKSPENDPHCPYKVPDWSAKPSANSNYRFEVLKSGQIIEEVRDLQNQPIWMFGRLPANDIEMAHPTISRFHAVLQYKPKPEKSIDEDDKKCKDSQEPPEGWYIYDLGSTHGTFLNKLRIPSRVYIRMCVGHMLRLGASTRSYILQGPVEDEEPESELGVTELREKRKQQEAAAAAETRRIIEEEAKRERLLGISWGMADDADEETDLTHNPYATTNNEELFLEDPKRTLRGYFEREDIPLEYKCDEMSVGSFVCRVELPIDDDRGKPLIAEVVHKGRKKECVVQCALEACRILDRHGVLRQANQEPLKRKKKLKDSDSDEDEFWDRTGDIERKKQRRANAGPSATLTYDDLLNKESELLQQLKQVEEDITKYQETQKRLKGANAQLESDDLDSFMENLNEEAPQLTKTAIRKLRMEEQRIKAEQQKLQRLLEIAKPIDLPFATSTDKAASEEQTNIVRKQLPLIGKRNQFSKFKIVKTQTMPTTARAPRVKAFGSDEEEMEEDGEHNDGVKSVGNPQETEQATNNLRDSAAAKGEEETIRMVVNKNQCEATELSQTISDKAPEAMTVQTSSSKGTQLIEVEESSEALSETARIEEQNEQSSKRRRYRQRLRNKRHEVDIDELNRHESSEMYAKWVPPENQNGDGYTELNEKYGY